MILKATATLLTLALLALGIQTWRASHYKARAISLQSVANALHDANQTNLATIHDLRIANEQWADKYAVDTKAAAKAAQDATEYAERQHKAAQSAQKALHDLSESHPEVRAWIDGAVPADVVRLLTEGGKD